MASKKSSNKKPVKKSTVKKAVKTIKKHTGLTVAIVIILVLVIAALVFGEYYFGWFGIFEPKDDDGKTPYKAGELEIHFLELGNKYSGDCTLIDIGDTEILIDAGSRQSSAETIVPYIQKYCEDGVLEYVIATHADQDHIAAFVGTDTSLGVFDSFECETIIDFPRTDKDTQIYKNYVSKRDAEVAAGAKHYTALECWNETGGAKRSYDLGNGISINFLYNYYYENKATNENDYSVCFLLTQGVNNYLFTGDLEEKGEEYLVNNNILPKCELFKGGHHGSNTSTTKKLLDVIKPKKICVCCCAGTDEYTKNKDNQFPTQDFVDRVAVHTDEVYVTTVVSDTAAGHQSMNGNIRVWSDGISITVKGSNNDLKLKETVWFKANRKTPAQWAA